MFGFASAVTSATAERTATSARHTETKILSTVVFIEELRQTQNGLTPVILQVGSTLANVARLGNDPR